MQRCFWFGQSLSCFLSNSRCGSRAFAALHRKSGIFHKSRGRILSPAQNNSGASNFSGDLRNRNLGYEYIRLLYKEPAHSDSVFRQQFFSKLSSCVPIPKLSYWGRIPQIWSSTIFKLSGTVRNIFEFTIVYCTLNTGRMKGVSHWISVCRIRVYPFASRARTSMTLLVSCPRLC